MAADYYRTVMRHRGLIAGLALLGLLLGLLAHLNTQPAYETRKSARTLVVSSPNAGEGKTTVTSNLGIALSKSKLRVVLGQGARRRQDNRRADSA